MMYATERQCRACFAAVLVVSLLIACGGYGSRDTEQPPAEVNSLEPLRTAVHELVGEPTCKTVAQCRAIAFGSKPCGGPWTYLVYSTETTDSTRLAALVAEYNSREAQMNREEGRVSDCRFVPVPRLDCVDSRCMAESR